MMNLILVALPVLFRDLEEVALSSKLKNIGGRVVLYYTITSSGNLRTVQSTGGSVYAGVHCVLELLQETV
jgi:hypothetical protein